MLSTKYLAAVPVFLSLSTRVIAWGAMSHETAASVALHYLQPDARDAVNQILIGDPEKKTTAPTMLSVSTWADEYRNTQPGRYTSTFHYIDAQDNPPDSCGVNFPADCTASGCVVSAIGNYTNRVQDSSLSAIYTAQALKFLIHFVADVTQPLHDEDKARGGNDISVKWDRKTTNLHHVWDTEMVEALAGTNTPAHVARWTNTIVAGVNPGGQYAGSVGDWISCITPSMIASVDATESCVTEWANDGNSYICSYVLNPDPSHTQMNGTYFEGAAPIIQEQIAKGGVRLAALLNMIFTGTTGFDSVISREASAPRFNIQAPRA